MPKRAKISTEEKISAVESYLRGKLSQRQAAQKAGVKIAPFQRWLRIYRVEGPEGLLPHTTAVTEFRWYEGVGAHKLYLSAILDLCDRRIVSYVLSEHNDNPLVYKTFDKAVQANPDAHPLFHSDRGYQYTSRAFHYKLQQAGMTQSMSRVGHCIDKKDFGAS